MHKRFKLPKGQLLSNVPGYRDPVDGGRRKVEAKEADATGVPRQHIQPMVADAEWKLKRQMLLSVPR